MNQFQMIIVTFIDFFNCNGFFLVDLFVKLGFEPKVIELETSQEYLEICRFLRIFKIFGINL